MIEDRQGGDVSVIEDGANGIHQFVEKNETLRLSYQLTYENRIDESRLLTFKHSLNYLDRQLIEPDYNFMGEQWSTFTELSYRSEKPDQSWITGLNLYTDAFREISITPVFRDYDYTTLGGFVQNTSKLSEVWSLESGLRLDYDLDFGFFTLSQGFAAGPYQ